MTVVGGSSIAVPDSAKDPSNRPPVPQALLPSGVLAAHMLERVFERWFWPFVEKELGLRQLNSSSPGWTHKLGMVYGRSCSSEV